MLPFSPPNIGEEEIAEVVDTLRSDWITTGPKTQRFEREFASAVGTPQCLALNSCTAALHLALVALGIGPGDAVLTTPMTFCSTVHAIEHVGARPILVDVEPDTLNLDPQKLSERIAQFIRRNGSARRLKAILPVHLYGHPCEMDSLLQIAREHRLAVIEDAAHALPARYRGRLIGSPYEGVNVPVLTCFSFYATKNLTTAEGGMLAGPVRAIERARELSLHGMSRDAWRRYAVEGAWFYEVNQPGFKYNMTDLQAAMGLHQFAKLSSFHARRGEIARRYNEGFSQCRCLQIPTMRAEADHAWHLYVLRLNLNFLGISRNEFIEQLRLRNISSSVHFIPVHMHRYYRDKYRYRPADFPVAHYEYARMLSLPLHTKMSDQDVEDVIEAVRDIVLRYSFRTTAPSEISARPHAASYNPDRPPAAGIVSRRAFDAVCAATGLALLAPLFALIALAIRFDDGGPVFYSQLRVGKGFRRFRLLKFRSMVVGADGGSLLTRSGDPRITRVGRLLRRFKLDELPQLVNVLRGEMRLVGVRPQVERFVEAYRREYEELLRVPPGITDLACLCFRNEEQLFLDGAIEEQYIQRILPAKLGLSLRYSRERTFFSDLEILMRTVLGLRNPSASTGEAILGAPLQPLPDNLHGPMDSDAGQEVGMEDLLSREPIEIDLDSVRRRIKGQTILVTGAAGTIGSELCRQVLRFCPAKLICVDRNETAMFYLERELGTRPAGRGILFCVTDFGDAERMRTIFSEHRPSIVFHAAAYKHVPIMENNVYDAVKNNVFGLLQLLEIADANRCPSFVLISSDKAVNPVNIMGVTKRVGERIVACRPFGGMRCVSVRFGNVLGSNGSVVRILQGQLRNHRPLTITHPEVARFFMTTREAVSLVLQAFAIGNHGDTLLLEMGDPVRILDLAKQLIQLAGKSEREVEVCFTGLREGEKLYEQLSYASEEILPTSSPKIGRIRGTPRGWPELDLQLRELRQSLCPNDDDGIRAKVKTIVPEFAPKIGRYPALVSGNGHVPTADAEALRAGEAVQVLSRTAACSRS